MNAILSEAAYQSPEGMTVTLQEVETNDRTAEFDQENPEESRRLLKRYWIARGTGYSEGPCFPSRAAAIAYVERLAWIHRRRPLIEANRLPDRSQYEAAAAAAGVPALSDEAIMEAGAAMEHGDFWMDHYPATETIRLWFAQHRYRALIAEREAARTATPVVPVQALAEQAIATLPVGELWQECGVRGCHTEPVNLCCERCDRHCTCRADLAESAALEVVAPGLQAKVAEYDDLARRGIE